MSREKEIPRNVILQDVKNTAYQYRRKEGKRIINSAFPILVRRVKQDAMQRHCAYYNKSTFFNINGTNSGKEIQEIFLLKVKVNCPKSEEC